MDPYQVLGVTAQDTPEEMRAAYRALVRTHHPDRYPDAAQRRQAELRMQEINEAWAAIQRDGGVDPGPDPTRARYRPHREWQPIDDLDEEDGWELFDDAPIGSGDGLPRSVQMVPGLLVAGAIVCFAISLVVGGGGLFAVGVVAMILGAVGFLAAPFVALSVSRRNDRG